MPPFRKPNLVTLRRQDLSQPWGFRLAGGVNQGQPFHVQKVSEFFNYLKSILMNVFDFNHLYLGYFRFKFK